MSPLPPTTPAVEPTLAKHEWLKQLLLKSIAGGEYSVGQQLPTEIELAQTHGLARNTVRQALHSLEQMGLVQRMRGRGTIVIDVQNHPSAAPQRVSTYGLVLPELEAGYYPSLHYSFNAALESVSGQIIVCDSHQDVGRQLDSLMRLVDGRVRGVAIVPVSTEPTPAYHFSALRQLKIPVVFCHRRVDGVAAPLITYSSYEVGYQGGKLLVEQGHRNVLYWTANDSTPTMKARFQGFAAAMREGGQHRVDLYDANYYRQSDMTDALQDRDREALRQMLSRSDAPTAIMASFDNEAERIWSLLDEIGCRVPVDVSLLGFGDTVRRSPRQKRLTSVAVHESKVGMLALHLINEITQGTRALDDTQTLSVEVTIARGATVAPPSPR